MKHNLKINIIYRYVNLLTKTLSKEFLDINRLELYKVIKCIYDSIFLTDIIYSYDDSKLLKIFKYFAEKRKCIFDILTKFNNDHNLSYNIYKMNLYVEYIIFFANITSNNDVYEYYGNLLLNIQKFPLLYPEFT